MRSTPRAIDAAAKNYTLQQLFACLVLKELFKLDYRRVAALRSDSESLRTIIGL